jgi:thiamine pyrophosphate-dependent acetolactate synthase large subunit-like protein
MNALSRPGGSVDCHPPLGHERLAYQLAEAGVSVAFGLPGVHNLPLWTSFAEAGIEIVGVRHEQAAGYAADGYARATGKLGVALVTTGPGAANAVCATGEAFTVGSPVLIIATDIATTVRREGVFRGALHECRDQAAMYAPVAKATFVCGSADNITAVTRRAIAVATEAPAGPVYLGLPIDLLDAPAPTPLASLERTNFATPQEQRGVVEVLSQADRVVVWIGGGAVAADCGVHVAEVAHLLAAPILTTYSARGLVPFDHPLVVTAPPQVPQVEQLWNDADVVLVIGSDLDAMMTRSWLMAQPKHIIAINVDSADAGKNYRADQVLVGDADAVLADLVDALQPKPHLAACISEVRQVNEAAWSAAREECPEAIDLLDALTFEVPPETNLVLDMCVAGYWVGAFARPLVPRKVAYPIGWGTLGFALPASIGTSAAKTGPTVVIVGDGGFMYATGELATLAQQKAAVTIVVVDDHAYGMLKYAQDTRGLPNLGVDLHTPDFVKLAESFHIEAVRVSDFGPEFVAALRAGTESGRPNLICVEAKLLPPPTTSTRAERVGVSTQAVGPVS